MITTQTATGLKLIDARRETTAPNAYKARQANISILLAALNDSLRAHSQSAARSPANWGFEADLAYAEDRLEEAVSFLARTK